MSYIESGFRGRQAVKQQSLLQRRKGVRVLNILFLVETHCSPSDFKFLKCSIKAFLVQFQKWEVGGTQAVNCFPPVYELIQYLQKLFSNSSDRLLSKLFSACYPFHSQTTVQH